MVDIEEQIDGLTEQEAKDALRRALDLLYMNTHCGDCLNGIHRGSGIFPCGSKSVCITYWLNEVLS